MPINSPFLQMFGRSPIEPLKQHMTKSHAAAEGLIDFFKAVYQGDWQQAEVAQQKIAAFEDEADELKKDLRLHLPNSLLMPVPRNDLLELLTAQDRVANKAEDIAGLVLGRKMTIPAEMADLYQSFIERSVAASAQANKAINELDELLETGFRGSEVKLVKEMIVTLNQVEKETDNLQIEIRRQLFSIENDLPPIDAIFLYKLIDWTGDLADRAQTVGGRLQLLLAH
jgi:uncharacterized protein